MYSTWKDRARLEAILAGLSASLYLASRLSRDFKETLRERSGIAEIRTADYAVAWRFHITHGRLRIVRGPHPNPDYAMVYKDTAGAVAVMTKGTEEAFMQAVMDGTLAFEGDLAFGMWFNELMQKLGSLLKEKMEALPLKRAPK